MNCPAHIGCVSFNLAPQQLPQGTLIWGKLPSHGTAESKEMMLQPGSSWSSPPWRMVNSSPVPQTWLCFIMVRARCFLLDCAQIHDTSNNSRHTNSIYSEPDTVMGSHRVGHDWSDLAAAAADTVLCPCKIGLVIILIFLMTKMRPRELTQWHSGEGGAGFQLGVSGFRVCVLKVKRKWSRSVMSDSLWPHGL